MALPLAVVFAKMAFSATTVEIPKNHESHSPSGPPVWNGQEPTLNPFCRTVYVPFHDDWILALDFMS